MTASEGDRSLHVERSADGLNVSRRQLLMGAAGVVMLGGLAACGGGSSPSTTPSPTGSPKRGGNFRLGVTGGGSKDIFDGQNIITKPDQARLVSAFETLLTFDDNYQLTNDGLATSVQAKDPTTYIINLRHGIEFQNGKTMTADDVIYSLHRIATKGNGLTGFAATATMDVAGIKKLDKWTVSLPLHSPDSTIPQTLASYTFGIVPTGYKAYPSEQIGTGPYKLKSFTPGQQSVSERNPNYWRSGEPYFDTVTIIDFADPTAQVNALLGGQIDAMTDLPASQVNVIKGHSMNSLISKTGGWLPLCMAIDMPPFDDVRVRQAMRLIVDRQQMIEQVASGFGFVANDLYAPFDEGYDKSLAQRVNWIWAGRRRGRRVDRDAIRGSVTRHFELLAGREKCLVEVLINSERGSEICSIGAALCDRCRDPANLGINAPHLAVETLQIGGESRLVDLLDLLDEDGRQGVGGVSSSCRLSVRHSDINERRRWLRGVYLATTRGLAGNGIIFHVESRIARSERLVRGLGDDGLSDELTVGLGQGGARVEVGQARHAEAA